MIILDNKEAGKKGGGSAKKAGLELEGQTGKPVITGENYSPPNKYKRLGGQ